MFLAFLQMACLCNSSCLSQKVSVFSDCVPINHDCYCRSVRVAIAVSGRIQYSCCSTFYLRVTFIIPRRSCDLADPCCTDMDSCFSAVVDVAITIARSGCSVRLATGLTLAKAINSAHGRELPSTVESSRKRLILLYNRWC